MRRLMPFLFFLLLLAAGWLWVRWFERSNLYFPEREITFLPSHAGLPYEDVSFSAPDGTRLHGWFVPGRPGRPTLLFCHGNGGNISHRVQKLRRLAALGLSVFLFDYAGYGRSAGRPSEEATYRDAGAAYDHLAEARGIPPEKIVLYGESLGAAVSVELATKRPVGAVILESAFTSTVAMGEHLLPWLPIRAMVRYRYDTLTKIPRLKAPLLILHSRTDEIVPFAMAQTLYEAAPGPKTLVELKGGHNDGLEVTGAAYERAIEKFLDSTHFPRRP